MSQNHTLARDQFPLEDRRYPIGLTVRSGDLVRLDAAAAVLKTTRCDLIRRCISAGLPSLEEEVRQRR
jgi:hypothetical protein